MLQLITDLSMIMRKDLDVTGTDVLVSGLQGSWVTLAAGKASLTSTNVGLAWPVWTESNRDGSVGFTPDAKNSKKITALVGKFFATTDQYTGTPVAGNPLKTGASGKLAVASANSEYPVAYCVKAPYTMSYFGKTITVIDIYVD